MKKLINILLLMATLTVSFSAMAADSDNDDKEISYRGQMLRRMQARKVRSRTRAVLLETYYGEKIESKDIKKSKRSASISSILREREIELNNGKVFRSDDIEFVFEASDNARAPHERIKGDNARAPHERVRNTERAPEDDEE